MRGLSIRIALAMVVSGFVHGFSRQAQADFVTYNFSNHIDETATEFSLPLHVQKFDPSMGTLESVEIVYTSKITANMSVTNGSNKHQDGTVYTEVVLTLGDPNNHIAQVNDISTSPESFSLGKGVTKSYPSDSGTDKATQTSDVTYDSSRILKEFTGTGKITLTVSTMTYDQLSANSNLVTSSTSATANANGYVTYVYAAAVPEPSSFVLGFMGALAIVGCGLRARPAFRAAR